MSLLMTDVVAPAGGPAALDRLSRVRGFVFDMDGTLVLGDARNHGMAPLPGALELTGLLAAQGIPRVVLTNGTIRTPQWYGHELNELGLDVDGVVTPASSAVEVALRRGHRRVMALGGDGLAQPLRDAGVEVLPPVGREAVDAVVVGAFREFGMESLEAACHAVWGGARLYSASQSVFYATADGRTLGTSRAICAAIRSVTGCRIDVVGKPSLHALRAASRLLGVPPRDLAVVGDDPLLEVPMAHRGGALAIAVHTGIGDRGSYDRLAPQRRPHLSLDGVADLVTLLRELHP